MEIIYISSTLTKASIYYYISFKIILKKGFWFSKHKAYIIMN